MSRQTPVSQIKKPADEQLLVSRDQARLLLGGISYISVARLEAAGKLRGVRLTDGPTSKRFYRRADVIALAETYYVKSTEDA